MERNAVEHREVARFLSGDDELIGEIERAIRITVHGFHLEHVSRAELVQEVISRLMSNLRAGRFRGEATLRTYAANIAKYVCLEQVRLRRAETRLGAANRVESPRLGPEEALLREERHVRNLKRFLSLPVEAREMLMMIFVEGLSYREVAERLGVSEGAVKLRVHRCRVSVRKATRAGGGTG